MDENMKTGTDISNEIILTKAKLYDISAYITQLQQQANQELKKLQELTDKKNKLDSENTK